MLIGYRRVKKGGVRQIYRSKPVNEYSEKFPSGLPERGLAFWFDPTLPIFAENPPVRGTA